MSISVSALGVVWYQSGGEMAEFLSASLIWGGGVAAVGGLGAVVGGVTMVRRARK